MAATPQTSGKVDKVDTKEGLQWQARQSKWQV